MIEHRQWGCGRQDDPVLAFSWEHCGVTSARSCHDVDSKRNLPQWQVRGGDFKRLCCNRGIYPVLCKSQRGKIGWWFLGKAVTSLGLCRVAVCRMVLVGEGVIRVAWEQPVSVLGEPACVCVWAQAWEEMRLEGKWGSACEGLYASCHRMWKLSSVGFIFLESGPMIAFMVAVWISLGTTEWTFLVYFEGIRSFKRS